MKHGYGLSQSAHHLFPKYFHCGCVFLHWSLKSNNVPRRRQRVDFSITSEWLLLYVEDQYPACPSLHSLRLPLLKCTELWFVLLNDFTPREAVGGINVWLIHSHRGQSKRMNVAQASQSSCVPHTTCCVNGCLITRLATIIKQHSLGFALHGRCVLF